MAAAFEVGLYEQKELKAPWGYTYISTDMCTPIYLSVSSVLIITSYPLVFPGTQPPCYASL